MDSKTPEAQELTAKIKEAIIDVAVHWGMANHDSSREALRFAMRSLSRPSDSETYPYARPEVVGLIDQIESVVAGFVTYEKAADVRAEIHDYFRTRTFCPSDSGDVDWEGLSEKLTDFVVKLNEKEHSLGVISMSVEHKLRTYFSKAVLDSEDVEGLIEEVYAKFIPGRQPRIVRLKDVEEVIRAHFAANTGKPDKFAFKPMDDPKPHGNKGNRNAARESKPG